MADDVALPAVSGTVAADERTINSATVKVQRVGEIGSTAVAVDQIAPASTATSASIAARETRKRLVVANLGVVDVYLSDRATNAGTPATTSAKSIKIPVGASLTLYTTIAVFIFTASGTGAVHYMEEYDS